MLGDCQHACAGPRALQTNILGVESAHSRQHNMDSGASGAGSNVQTSTQSARTCPHPRNTHSQIQRFARVSLTKSPDSPAIVADHHVQVLPSRVTLTRTRDALAWRCTLASASWTMRNTACWCADGSSSMRPEFRNVARRCVRRANPSM
jgi:hypothetical protein